MPLLALPALWWAGASDAQSADPQALIAAQRAQVRDVVSPGCRADDPEEITVCGRRDDRGPRGPLPAIPYAPLPGTIPPGALAGGEQRAAMANERCVQRCPQPVQINIIGALRSIGNAIENLRE